MARASRMKPRWIAFSSSLIPSLLSCPATELGAAGSIVQSSMGWEGLLYYKWKILEAFSKTVKTHVIFWTSNITGTKSVLVIT
jgi:hypothetical protein